MRGSGQEALGGLRTASLRSPDGLKTHPTLLRCSNSGHFLRGRGEGAALHFGEEMIGLAPGEGEDGERGIFVGV